MFGYTSLWRHVDRSDFDMGNHVTSCNGWNKSSPVSEHTNDLISHEFMNTVSLPFRTAHKTLTKIFQILAALDFMGIYYMIPQF